MPVFEPTDEQNMQFHALDGGAFQFSAVRPESKVESRKDELGVFDFRLLTFDYFEFLTNFAVSNCISSYSFDTHLLNTDY